MRLIEEVDVAPAAAPAAPSAAAAAAVAAGTAAVKANHADEWGGGDGDGGEVPMQVPNLTSAEAAGAYTRLLFSSTSAVSDTQEHPTQPEHPLRPLNTG